MKQCVRRDFVKNELLTSKSFLKYKKLLYTVCYKAQKLKKLLAIQKNLFTSTKFLKLLFFLQKSLQLKIRSPNSLVVYDDFLKSTCCRAQPEAYDDVAVVEKKRKRNGSLSTFLCSLFVC